MKRTLIALTAMIGLLAGTAGLCAALCEYRDGSPVAGSTPRLKYGVRQFLAGTGMAESYDYRGDSADQGQDFGVALPETYDFRDEEEAAPPPEITDSVEYPGIPEESAPAEDYDYRPDNTQSEPECDNNDPGLPGESAQPNSSDSASAESYDFRY